METERTEERAHNDMTRNLKENIPVISYQSMGFRVFRILRSLRIIPFMFAFVEGFKSLVKIGQHFYNNWIEGMKEAAAMSERNAESIREAAEAVDKDLE